VTSKPIKSQECQQVKTQNNGSTHMCQIAEVQYTHKFNSYTMTTSGWPQRKRKKSLSFSGFSRAINLLFHRLLQQKECNNNLHQGSFHMSSSNITGHHHILTMSEIHVTQSTAVLHKYLNDELKIFCFLQFFPEVAQNSLGFPCSEKSLSIPGLWPPCMSLYIRFNGYQLCCQPQYN